eukprot:CAMPEP_0185851562 /NCGR_PEP_ID=MMETSP1354-20130828/10385_1 /TAXON_ID=708628 /ORGANISM="Erythrolobus madagascarensis, Strain CCMP3276" /LENGTH=132 /DNA_ID=CAMNT_0028552577 /DNA_START=129 /DNA_END=527 /DNA_ORIENTATION=+
MAFVSVSANSFVVGSASHPQVRSRDAHVKARSAYKRAATIVTMASDDSGIWQGDWICVDCGYVYTRDQRVKFENLPETFRCPQCRATKRRFAKKAGDKVAKTTSTSNTPIIIVSLVGLVGLLIFAVWAATSL